MPFSWSGMYRHLHWKEIMVPGGAKNPPDILRDYLGREPSIDSFIDTVKPETVCEYSLGRMTDE